MTEDESDFQFPYYDPLELTTYRPPSWDALWARFDKWLNGGGRDSNAEYLKRCGRYCQRVLPKERELVVLALRIHGGIWGWVNPRIPDAMTFLLMAKALAPDVARAEAGERWHSMTATEKDTRCRILYNLFTRALEQFNQLKETVEKRTESLRSLNANERTQGKRADFGA